MKRHWILYLSIGVIASLMLSCEEQTEYKCRASYLYINATERVVKTPFRDTTTDAENSIYTIAPNDTLTIIIESDGPENTIPESYVPPVVGDLTFYFGEDRSYTYKSTSAGEGEGPTGMSNYKAKKNAPNDFSFTYTFTQDDYNNATLIE